MRTLLLAVAIGLILCPAASTPGSAIEIVMKTASADASPAAPPAATPPVKRKVKKKTTQTR